MSSKISLHAMVTTLIVTSSSLTAPPVYAGNDFVKGMAGGLIGAAIYNGIKNNNAQQEQQEENHRDDRQRRTQQRSTEHRVVVHMPSPEVIEGKKIQAALAAAGFYSGNIDGILGAKTKESIQQFQQHYGLATTGTLSPQEKTLLLYQASLTELSAHLNYMGFDQRSKGKQLQAALKIEGFYSSKIDGAIGQGSRKAIGLYQQSKGIAPTGNLLPDQEAALIASAKQKIHLQRQQSEQQLAQMGAGMQPTQPAATPAAAYPTPMQVSQPVAPMPQIENAPVLAANSPTTEPQTQTRAQTSTPTNTSDPLPQSREERPNLYLLSIGISKYEDKTQNLKYADEDAEAIARTFKTQQGKLYNQVKVRLLTNSLADKDNVLDGLDWLIKESTQNDVAVIFVAGHGIKDDGGQYYFMSHDSDADHLRRTGIKWYEFQDAMERVPGKRWLLADTCHSGGITGKRDIAGISDALRDLRKVEGGVVVMTAATGREASVESPEWEHGAFTLALIEGLEQKKANFNGDNRIDIKELDLFVTNRVKELTGGRQHPTTEIPTVMPNFPIAVLDQ